MNFASDNSSPSHPKVMEALMKANEGFQLPYGADTIMEDVRTKIRTTFEAPDAAVYLVATGTSANAIALASLCPPWGAIYGHRNSHIEEDECGAPEFYTGGGKIVLIDGDHAKMRPEGLHHALKNTALLGVHQVQRGAVSITNTTENGAVYSLAEVEELCAVAKEFAVPCHMDGARFANAIVATNASPAEMTWKAGVDILSFGGTKNGLLGVEAVVIFNPDHAWEFELRRKRAGHLFSKHRYLSAQMDAYLEDGLWLEMAKSANAASRRLADGIASLDGASIDNPAQANMIFASWPRAGHRRAIEAGAKYYLTPPDQQLDGDDNEPLTARLVCSWCTTEADVDQFLGLIKG